MHLIAKGLDLLQASLITTAVFSVTLGLFAFEQRAPRTIIEPPEEGEIVQFSLAEANTANEEQADQSHTAPKEDDKAALSEEELNEEELNGEKLNGEKLSKPIPLHGQKTKKLIKKKVSKQKPIPNAQRLDPMVKQLKSQKEKSRNQKKEISPEIKRKRNRTKRTMRLAKLQHRKKMMLKKMRRSKRAEKNEMRSRIKKSKNAVRHAKTKKKRQNKKCLPKPSQEILSLNNEEWLISKPLFKRYVEDWDLARKLAHLTWSKDKKGKTDGFRIKRIKCRSQLALLGIEKNDVILAVNGINVDGISAALGLYWELRRTEKVDIVLRRKNKTINLRYRVVG